MLNRQLLDVMKAAKFMARLRHHQYFRPQFKARCFILSHEVDELAMTQRQLQILILRINDILKWQGLGVTNVSLICAVFSMLWVGEFTISENDWVGMFMGF